MTFTLQPHKDEMVGDIFDRLLPLLDFLSFKEMLLDYRAEKGGQVQEVTSGLVATCANHLSVIQSTATLAFTSSQWDCFGHLQLNRLGED